ncbi:MAG: glutamyl-tRNA amidotransferase [Bacteroidetes bacterium GWA2_31_9b]|nr:MAG: glutamyl-tRNA amidotransferase [Bacteroidetes bacterium GWA2_31_9b]
MSLIVKIDQDIKTAMLAREKDKLEALRAVKSALLLARTEKGATEEISEDTEIKLLQRLVKQRKESAAIYQQQNRKDLADKELFEVSIIDKYLPEQMSDEELTKIIKSLIEQTGAKGMADMGKVIGMASKQLAGKAEGKAIADKVKTLLTN